MKDNIERLFKESLENYSVPYDASAWTALSEKMGKAPATPFYRKWWFAASVIAVAGASSLLLLNDQTEIQKQAGISRNSNLAQVSAGQENHETTSRENPSPTESVVASDEQISDRSASQIPVVSEIKGISGIIDNVIVPEDKRIITLSAPPSDNTPKSTAFLPLNLPSSVCMNEQFEVYNPNKSELIFVIHPNGKTTGIKSTSKVKFTASQAGTYQFISGDHKDYVKVNEPTQELSIIRTSNEPIENGVPNMVFEVQGTDKNVSWSTNVSSSSTKENTFVVHPFRENTVEITANSTDVNGCAIQAKQKFDFPERYNLMAPGGLNLSSSNYVNRTFMPEALKLRDVAFELAVLDAKTQAIVFKTTDAAQPWDGTDAIHGGMAAAGTVWIWKAIIKNPLPGEPRVYSGTITVVE